MQGQEHGMRRKEPEGLGARGEKISEGTACAIASGRRTGGMAGAGSSVDGAELGHFGGLQGGSAGVGLADLRPM